MDDRIDELDMGGLVAAVEDWARARGLDKSTGKDQLLKTMEEAGELAKGLRKKDRAEIIDGYGDVTVTLIAGCVAEGLDFEECLRTAYREIANRKGKTVDGIFVKSSDLGGNP